MKSLQIGYADLNGRRFNGHDLHRMLLKRGISSQHAVWTKESDEPDTWRLCDFKWKTLGFEGRNIFRKIIELIEKQISVQSVLYPFSYQFLFDKRFYSADIVHYHLIHAGHFSITSLPFLSHIKPSVWSLHDPWAMTGHCIYPYDCEKWKTGCGNCPDLTIQIAMKKDRSAMMWKAKKIFYGASRFDIVLASKWMLNMAQQSPLLSKFRLHHIPYGIDLNKFRPMDVESARQHIGVFPGSVAICFRAALSQFKGISFILESLRRLKTDVPVCLITFEERGLVDEFRGKYQIIDLGWTNDEDLTIAAYNAADIFLMPSTAEAFGLMAAEAMACGKPVIVFDKTSLPEVIFAPEGGISVPQGDTYALIAALESLIKNPEKRLKIGERALKLARENYDVETHVDRMLELYRDVIERKNN